MIAPEFLDLEEVLEIHPLQLDEFGGIAGVRDRGLLESAVDTRETREVCGLFDPRQSIRLYLAEGFHRTAWDLANLYLSSVGADLLSDTAPSIVGLSQETTCFVSAKYFAEQDPFADFVVHEAAHIFHNCKRSTLGLRETHTKEWLLPVDFQERETFAYSCEAHACILRRAKSGPERRALADEYARTVRVPDERVDSKAVADIVREAAQSRNGWKVISSRCARPSA